MSLTNLGVVWNPSKTDRSTLDEALEQALTDVFSDAESRAELRVHWFETSADDPGRSATKEALAAGATVVAAAGGDGTVRAVAEELAESGADAELAVIPLGTGNLLARNLGVPLNSVRDAFARALTATATLLDVGWAEVESDAGSRRYAFVVMAGFGIDAHMITETDDDLKDRAGWLAYIESLGRAVSASEVLQLTLRFDDGAPVQTDAHTLMVGNCGTLQGGITLLPDADPGDGLLDSLLLSAEGIGGWLDTARNLVWENGVKRLFGGEGSAESTDSATHRQLSSLSVDLPAPRVCEVDGDDVGEATHLTFTVQPAAIRVR